MSAMKVVYRHSVLYFGIDFYNVEYSLSRKKLLVLFQLVSKMCANYWKIDNII